MKNTREMIIMAAVFSIAAHTLFIISSHFISLPGMRDMRSETRSLFRVKTVEDSAETVRLFQKEKDEIPSIKMSGQMSHEDRGISGKILEDQRKNETHPDKKKERFLNEEPEAAPLSVGDISAADILEAEEEKARESADPEKRSFSGRYTGEDIIRVPERALAKSEDMTYVPDQKSFKWIVPTTGMANILKTGLLDPGSRILPGFNKDGYAGKYGDISSFLDVEVYKYEDPVSDDKYFKIVISVDKKADLRIIPKEIIFLIDSSKSITAQKLEYIKKGVIETLWHLNPGDKFNIVAFRGNLIKFRERSVEKGMKNLFEAEIFTKKLEASGQTDVENALLGIVDTPPDFYPSYIMLVTDGRPTTGVIDSRRIIEKLTRRNAMQRSIFSFGGGARVNRYLLDFISYQNRGWSKFADRTYLMVKELGELYAEIKDPLLLDVRYRFSGLDKDEIYPRNLPDFYKGRELVLYGKFGNEDVFSMQLLGRIDGETKELIFKRSLKEAENGSRDIADKWAFMKIYHLIGEDTHGNGKRTALHKEIKDLSEKYGVTTPYDI